MATSDYIASCAFFISLVSLIHSIYSKSKSIANSLKKERKDYLKSLNRMVKSITFNSSEDEKQNKLNLLRDELNFCTCYENMFSFQGFSEDIDDNVYLMCTTEVEDDFINLRDNCSSVIINFKD